MNPPAARPDFPAAPASAEPDGQAEGGEPRQRPAVSALDVVDPAQGPKAGYTLAFG